jgi:hypothetical protein
MNNWLNDAFYQVTGAFISGLVGVGSFWIKRRWEAKDHFRVTMSRLGAEIKAGCDPLAFYDTTLPRLEEAVFTLRPFLTKSDADCLSTCWGLYRQARTELDKPEWERAFDHAFDEECNKYGWKTPKTKREIIDFFHKKLTEIAK